MSKQVMQQALDALEANHNWHADYDELDSHQESELHMQNRAAIEALRADIMQLEDDSCRFEDFHQEQLRQITLHRDHILRVNDKLRAELAGMDSATGHMSALVDEQHRLLIEVNSVFGTDPYGLAFEDGDSELIDKVREHLAGLAPLQTVDSTLGE